MSGQRKWKASVAQVTQLTYGVQRPKACLLTLIKERGKY